MSVAKILIDARLRDGEAGGIQQVVIGLAQGLAEVKPLGFRIAFLMLEGHTKWLEPYLYEGVDILKVPCGGEPERRTGGILGEIKSLIRGRIGHLLGRFSIRLPLEPAAVSAFDPDLIHFVHQNCFETDRPNIFTPHDLQHEYFPEYFDKRTLMVRRELYWRHAHQCARVACISEACRNDVVNYLGIKAEKCSVVYNAPPTASYPKPDCKSLKQTIVKFGLPDRFLYFPAKTYPHKNHLSLVRALHDLRSISDDLSIVCSGPLTDYYDEVIAPEVERLGVGDQIKFLGWCQPVEVSSLYHLSDALVFPSLFEGFGIPLVEAMSAGVPIICSNASCMPEIVGEAGCYFDPHSSESLVKSILEIWNDDDLRYNFSQRGIARSDLFSWKRSVQEYLRVYGDCLNEK